MRRLAAVVALSLLASACQKPDAPAADGVQTSARGTEAKGGKMGAPKPGLWEVATDDGETRETIRQCIMTDAAEVKQMIEGAATDGCTKAIDESRNAISVRMTCPNAGVSQAEFSMKGSDTQREMMMTMTANGEKMVQRSSMRWLGPCPAGLTDGDIVQD